MQLSVGARRALRASTGLCLVSLLLAVIAVVA
jgi:hypothetical protein